MAGVARPARGGLAAGSVRPHDPRSPAAGGARPGRRAMKAREILDAKGRGVVTIRSDATLSTAVHRLALERIGALVVSDDGGRGAGLPSARAVATRPGPG